MMCMLLCYSVARSTSASPRRADSSATVRTTLTTTTSSTSGSCSGPTIHRASSASPVRFPLITTLRHVTTSPLKEYVSMSLCESHGTAVTHYTHAVVMSSCVLSSVTSCCHSLHSRRRNVVVRSRPQSQVAVTHYTHAVVMSSCVLVLSHKLLSFVICKL